MAHLNDAQKRYRQSEKYRSYLQSEECRAARKRYMQSEAGRAAARKGQTKYRQSERGKQVRLAYRLGNGYGLTPEQYQSLVIAQDNKCALCGKSGDAEHHGRLSVDHCHKTNRVRGLLCKDCNVALGIWEKLDHEKIKAYLGGV